MENVTTIGIDIAKNFIQVHGATEKGKTVFKKRVKRGDFLAFMETVPRCVVGMEACGGSHYWAQELQKRGFEARMISAKKVKRFVDNHKNDEKDAEACAEAVGRANMTFVPIKNAHQIEIQGLHRVRSHYVRQHTALMNMIRGLLLELGIAIPRGETNLVKRLKALVYEEKTVLSEHYKPLIQNLYEDLKHVADKVKQYTEQLKVLAKRDALCQKLQSIEGIGPISSTALIAKIGNGSEFKNGRELSAYLGLVPKQHSSGETQLLLGISKQGDRYLRQLLIHGGRAVVQACQKKERLTGHYKKQDKHSQWVRALTERIGVNKASVAVANKNARIVVALLKNQTTFEPELAHEACRHD